MKRNAVLDRPKDPIAQGLSPTIAAQLGAVMEPALKELKNEGAARELLDDTHTVSAADLCSEQAKRAAAGWRARFRGDARG